MANAGFQTKTLHRRGSPSAAAFCRSDVISHLPGPRRSAADNRSVEQWAVSFGTPAATTFGRSVLGAHGCAEPAAGFQGGDRRPASRRYTDGPWQYESGQAREEDQKAGRRMREFGKACDGRPPRPGNSDNAGRLQ
jgi:hypothetical protein